MQSKKKWIRCALELTLLIALVWAMASSCGLVLEPGDDEAAGYLELNVGEPGTAKLIQVTEYEVTSLWIEVTGPDGGVIQQILWEPVMGPRTYRIPVEQLGAHEVAVAHRSNTQQGQIEAVESATFNIQPMIITEVRIIPGAVGILVVDEERRAADLRARQVLPEILEVAEPRQYVVTRLPEMLPQGTRIVEDMPDMVDQEPQSLTLGEGSYIYYIDLQPGAFYEHPVKYLLVGKSGETQVVDAKWWPTIDNEVPEPLVSATPTLTNVLERNVVIERPVIDLIDIQIRPDIIQLIEREAFVCVQGLRPSESLYDCSVTSYQNAYNFFDSYRSGFSTIVGLTDYAADDVLDEIADLADDGYDIITIYVLAHGGYNYVRLGGVAVTASQFAARMREYTNVEFNFLCGSCHSGSFIDDLRIEENVRMIDTACTSAESAWPDKDLIGSISDTNSSDTGSEWTSSWIQAAQVIANNATLWNVITTRADTYSVPATSVLLNEAGYLGAGENRGLPSIIPINYDLTYEAGWSTPQHYNSWENLY